MCNKKRAAPEMASPKAATATKAVKYNTKPIIPDPTAFVKSVEGERYGLDENDLLMDLDRMPCMASEDFYYEDY